MRQVITALAALAAFPVAAASAADMPLKASPPVAATVFSWTGIYIGAEAGYGGTRSDSTRLVANSQFLAGTTDSVDRYGSLLGFVVGANYQFNWLVLGVEGDWQYSLISGTATQFGNTPAALATGNRTAESRETNSIATVAGRLGVAWDRWMIFGKGGAAWRRIDQSAGNDTFTAANALVSSSSTAPANEHGYVVGGGLEWAPSDIVSVKLEGDWYNFGNNLSAGGTCIVGACGGPGAPTASGQSTTKSTAWEIKGGVNMRLNWLAGLGH
jgi:outer membrane immunogenic protein